MAHDYRDARHWQRMTRDHRGDRYVAGTEQYRYDAGDDPRYFTQRDPYHRHARGERDRSYGSSGYPEEFGYRRSARNERYIPEDYHQRTSGAFIAEPLHWDRSRDDLDEYFGTGVQAGAYGSAPGARASRTRADWHEPLGEFGDEARFVSGDYASYARSEYAAQSPYGRPIPRTSSRGFRGSGPKGYERSDERLKETICERLSEDPYIDASDVTVEVIAQSVRLTGTVADRRTKFEIEELIEVGCRVENVDNQLRIQNAPEPLNPNYRRELARPGHE